MPQPANKLEQTIVYLLKRSAAHRPPLTVLLKMLWYADYAHYYEHLSSITGARYVAMKRGPVVDRYRELLDSMEERGLLAQEQVTNDRYPGSPPAQFYTSCVTPDLDAFSETELDIIEAVIAACAHHTGHELSEWTHDGREPWSLVWDESGAPKEIPQAVWRWSANLPDEADLALAVRDVERPHVAASLAKLRSEFATSDAR